MANRLHSAQMPMACWPSNAHDDAQVFCSLCERPATWIQR